MGIRQGLAQTAGKLAAWGLRDVLHRQGGHFPGMLALRLNPQFIADVRGRLTKGSILVVGTNGKTTVTNLLADCLEQAGAAVACNRDGANLATGVATTLLGTKRADWGVFEIDELWLARVAPGLQPAFVVLLDLFRDQLDRMGEVSAIQRSIERGLAASPGTILIYNADDPNCAAIAEAVGNKCVSFGAGECLNLAGSMHEAAQMCAVCGDVLQYRYRQYDQLGDYSCPSCGLERPEPDYAACGVTLNAGGMGFDLLGRHVVNAATEGLRIHARWNSAYMVYNLTAVATAALLAGCPLAAVQDAVDAFDPRNGRLQWMNVRGRRTLLNLAKNPTGFNQNLQIVLQDENACAVAFFVNDAEGDGRDPSWLWNVDFEMLASRQVQVFAGGTRASDLLLRLKYAGVQAREAQCAADVYDAIEAGAECGECGECTSAGPVGSAFSGPNPFKGPEKPLPATRGNGLAGASADRGPECGSAGPVACGDFGHESPKPPSGATRGNGLAGASADGARSGGAVYLIANYTALPPLREELARDGEPIDLANVRAAMAAACTQGRRESASTEPAAVPPEAARPVGQQPAGQQPAQPVVIVDVLPELLGVFADGGNATVLRRRLEWRGIPVQVREMHHGDSLSLQDADAVLLGGSMGAEQRMAANDLVPFADELRRFVQQGGAVLGVCGGFQLLGTQWLADGEKLPCLGAADIATTERSDAQRVVRDVVRTTPLVDDPVVGFENHAAAVQLGAECTPFAALVSQSETGSGTAAADDGVLCGNLVGTNLHGPVLAKNPQLADEILRRALNRWAERTGNAVPQLEPLDDAEERAARAYLLKE